MLIREGFGVITLGIVIIASQMPPAQKGFVTGYVRDRDRQPVRRPLVTILAVRQAVVSTRPTAARTPWGSQLSVPEFNSAIQRIVTSLRERKPLESLKGERNNGTKIPQVSASWRPVLTLPGADTCGIDEQHIVIRGHVIPPFLSYGCDSVYESSEAAMDGYRALVGLVSAATGWKAEEDSGGTTHLQSGKPKDASCTVSVNTANVALVSMLCARR